MHPLAYQHTAFDFCGNWVRLGGLARFLVDGGKTKTQAGKTDNRYRAIMYRRKDDLESNHLR